MQLVNIVLIDTSQNKTPEFCGDNSEYWAMVSIEFSGGIIEELEVKKCDELQAR